MPPVAPALRRTRLHPVRKGRVLWHCLPLSEVLLTAVLGSVLALA